MEWNFERNESTAFQPIPEGVHRIRIKSAEKAVSKTGKDMLTLQFNVSGYSSILYHYIVFLPDRPEITNRRLTKFFDSFRDIREGDLDLRGWVGKVGACKVKHEEYNGEMQARLHYFIPAEKQGDLPPWKETSTSASASTSASTSTSGFVPVQDDDLPF